MPGFESITTGSLVSEALQRVPHAGRVFELLEVNACCEPERTTLARGAEAAGLDPEELLALLGDADATPLSISPPPPGLADASLRTQIEYVVGVHHRFTRRQLLRLDRQLTLIRGGHRRSIGWLAGLTPLLHELTDDLIPHMAREERYLFPYCISLEEGMKPDVRIVVPLFGNLDYPLASIKEDHADDLRRLKEMRRLTSGFQAEPDSCRTLRRFLEGLAQLERALHEHIHIETRMIFPKAKARERG